MGEAELEFLILGPLEVREDGRPVQLGGRKQRAVLAVLLLNAGEVVSTERLIDALWGERPPSSATNSVHIYVSQLRKALGEERLLTREHGYLLDARPDEMDSSQFERLVEQGSANRAAGNHAAAAKTLADALALWRGTALADFAHDDFPQAAIGRLEELRLAANDERIEAELEVGGNGALVSELETIVRANPLRERSRGQLMLALYRDGRQAEALEVFRATREMLQRELGLEPGPELQRLERAILTQDRALEHAQRRISTRLRRPGLLLAIGAALLLAAAVAVAIELARGQGSGLSSIAANSLGVIDLRSNRLAAQVPAGIRPGPITYGDGAVWVANVEDRTVSRIDPASHRLVRTIAISGIPAGLSAGDGAVWVSTTEGGLYRINPRFDEVARVASVAVEGRAFTASTGGIATGLGDVWVADSIGLVSQVDRLTGRIDRRFEAGNGASGVAVGAGSVWVTNAADGTVTRLDPTGVTATVSAGHGPSGIAVGAGAVWVTNSLDGTLVRIDPDSNAIAAVISVGGRPTAVAVAGGSVWVAVGVAGTVVRVDPASNRMAGSIRLANTPEGLAAVGRTLWVSVAARPPATTSGEGGVGRVEVGHDPGSLDPALASRFATQLQYLTCAKLMNYPDRPAPEGSQLVPEVAQSAPSVTHDGRRYTFVVRRGFRLSPPSNEQVTAESFKYAIERSLSPRLPLDEGVVDLSAVVGVRAYRAGQASHIAGVIANGNTLTIRLRRPEGNLLALLSTPSFCAVPLGTPVNLHGTTPVPSAGPYYVASYTPGQKLVLRRNPNYQGERPRRLRELDVSIGVGAAEAVAKVESGTADFAATGIPPSVDRRLRARYGRGSPAARRGQQRYFVNPNLTLRFLALNTSRPLFSSARLRRAVAYAIDRRRLAAQERRWGRGGTPADRYLPKGMPGAPRGQSYRLRGPDLARARALAGSVWRTAVLYACSQPPCPQEAAAIRSDLREIGIKVVVRIFPTYVMYARLAARNEPYDMVTVGWGPDYPDPATFLNALLVGVDDGRFSSSNFSRFHDAVYTARLQRAAQLSGAARYRAYARLALDLEQKASPLVVYGEDETRDFFSTRVGCHVYQPVYGMDLATLCLRR